MPALVAAAAYPGVSEPFACALALGGLTAWVRHKTWWAVGLFAAATVTRETLLLVPLGVTLDHVVRHRSLQKVLPLLAVPATYAAWVGVVYVRIGALPSSYSPMDGPLVGFRTGFPNWKLAEWLTAVLLVSSVVAIMRWGRGWAKAILAAHAVFFLFMNYQVWWVWWGFGRVGTILPLLALVAIAEHRSRTGIDPASMVEPVAPVLEPARI